MCSIRSVPKFASDARSIPTRIQCVRGSLERETLELGTDTEEAMQCRCGVPLEPVLVRYCIVQRVPTCVRFVLFLALTLIIKFAITRVLCALPDMYALNERARKFRAVVQVCRATSQKSTELCRTAQCYAGQEHRAEDGAMGVPVYPCEVEREGGIAVVLAFESGAGGD